MTQTTREQLTAVITAQFPTLSEARIDFTLDDVAEAMQDGSWDFDAPLPEAVISYVWTN